MRKCDVKFHCYTDNGVTVSCFEFITSDQINIFFGDNISLNGLKILLFGNITKWRKEKVKFGDKNIRHIFIFYLIYYFYNNFRVSQSLYRSI